MKNTYLDYKNVVDSYLSASDWRVKENSTVNYSVGGLILSNSGAITANYWLSEIYDDEIANAHKNADLHLHDLSMLTGYCAGWSLKQLIQEGLGGIPRQDNLLPGQPPLHALQPDGQLPRHHAERMGRSAGLFQLRHLPRALRQGGQPQLQRGQAVHPELRLRRQHALPLGYPGPLQQHHPRLDRTRRPQGPEGHRRRQGDGLHLRRLQGRDGHGQQGLHRHHDRGRRQRPRLPVPDTHLLHHPRPSTGPPRRTTSCSSR